MGCQDVSWVAKDYSKVCVSLSGGVDSMVLLYNLAQLQCASFEVSAIHINYNNRESCPDEVVFVQQFCNRLDVSLDVCSMENLVRTRDKNRLNYEKRNKIYPF